MTEESEVWVVGPNVTIIVEGSDTDGATEVYSEDSVAVGYFHLVDDAKRAVQCVNACRGVARPPVLTDVADVLGRLLNAIGALCCEYQYSEDDLRDNLPEVLAACNAGDAMLKLLKRD